jgi:tripartite-type tricarboxylate transporter receptor subunit TctC
MVRSSIKALAAVCALSCAGATQAQSQSSVESFYKGKQIRVLIASAPASDYDMFARLITAQMTKTLPGNPTFIHQNVPGAGGLVVANNLYNIAAQDGTVIGMLSRNMPHVALAKMANVQFDPNKFNWLGSPEISHAVCAAITGVPVQTAQDLFEKELLVGGAGAGSSPSVTSYLLNNLLGMKFKLVEGYQSVPDVSLAMMRREVHGVCQSLNALRGGNLQGWIEAGKLKLLFNLEPKAIPGVDVPSIFSFAKTEEQKSVLMLNASTAIMGRPMATPPNVPAERVAALRHSFNLAVNNPELQAEVLKVGGEVTLVPGEEMQKVVADIMATPQAIADKLQAMSTR